jgi:hypothetical protein
MRPEYGPNGVKPVPLKKKAALGPCRVQAGPHQPLVGGKVEEADQTRPSWQ